jgi:ABC-type sugar transport system ATPase subunit
MNIVSGVYKADSGEVFLDGGKYTFKDPNDAFNLGIAIIHQETSLFEEMTILENIFLGHEPTKKVAGITVIDYKAMIKEAKRIFKLMNLEMDMNEKIKKLGMAQKQMVEIVKALTFHSRILILDEPTASLTQREVISLFEVVRKLKKDGVSIVYISHRLEEIFEICDRVTVIRDGKFISCKQVSETNKNDLIADMVGRSLNNYYPKSDVQIGKEIFKVENLNKRGLLSNISFTVNRGEIVGFAGLAGAGRTELAQAICGLIKKDSGVIYIDGKKAKIHKYRDALENEIVYVSEDRSKYGLILEMSIKQNITMSQLKKVSKHSFIDFKMEEAVAKRYIENVGIKTPDADFLVENLSGGNQQKVSVSKALALQPKLLILDEPTRGVDVNAKAEIHYIISKLIENGLTIILISSEMPELLGMCDRIFIMKNGRIAGELNRKEATQERILQVALAVD